jgi:CheY-like chemotaxis protein/anti-sigma regulatory factor (Ser/Thr protein kinase)
MQTILVVDDVALDRHVAGALLEEHSGWSAVFAEDGKEALALIKLQVPDIVVTDLQMPEMNGLELVEAIRRSYSHVPVILMTAHGSEEIAVAALKAGAASYVPKRDLARDLVPTTAKALAMARASRNQQQILDCLVETELRFLLSNDPHRVQPLVNHLQDHMILMDLVDQGGMIRVGTALHECLINAMEHGNLELTSELRESEDINAYRKLVDERRKQPPYCDRRVLVVARFSRKEASFVIRDEGNGFDSSKLPDPTDPANLQKCSGRGLFLIRTFMDVVRFNDRGNEITMIKRPQH